ncbi:MAG: hypothetical protein KGI71_00370 [Patescibacteria group bacterium]|nr:hypothetical protein [Patescibacteria group bacterium]
MQEGEQGFPQPKQPDENSEKPGVPEDKGEAWLRENMAFQKGEWTVTSSESGLTDVRDIDDDLIDGDEEGSPNSGSWIFAHPLRPANDSENAGRVDNQSPGTEGTPKEWREKLRGLIKGANERFGFSERAESLQGYLAERSKGFDTKAKEYGPKAEKLIRSLGEKYNKLGWKSKLAVGASLGIGAAAFSGVSTSLALLFGAGLAAQRVAGMTGMFLKFEKHLQDTGEGKSQGFFAQQEWYKKIAERPEQQRKLAAAIMSLTYTGAMSVSIGEAVHLASGTAWGEATHEWLKQHWPFGTAEPAPATAHNGREVSGIIRHPEAVPAPSAPPMPEISVPASTGHGAEYMLKRVWEDLQEKHLDPSNYAQNSDIHRLLTADAHSIDTLVHQIAADPQHGFFHADGTSVRISPDAHMTIDEHGEILLSDPGHKLTWAPSHLPTAPAHSPEAPAAHPEAVLKNIDSPAVPEVPVSAGASLPAETVVAPHAPAAEHAPAPESIPAGHPGTESSDGPVLHDNEGSIVQDREGSPVHTEAYGSLPENAPSATEHAIPNPEVPPPPAVAMEHTSPFINHNALSVDPTHEHIFQDTNGALLAYGNDHDAQFRAAQEYVKTHHDAIIWVQAGKPVFYNGEWKPWVYSVQYGGWWRGVYALIPTEAPDPSQIGGINPETFIKQLDK